jgi:hypothetical protein
LRSLNPSDLYDVKATLGDDEQMVADSVAGLSANKRCRSSPKPSRTRAFPKR